MKKKVLFLADSLGCGGSEQSLISLLTTLDYTQIEVDLWLHSRGGLFEKYLPSEVNIVDYNPSPKSKLGYWLACKLYSIKYRLFKNVHAAELLWSCVEKHVSPMSSYYDVAISFQQGFPTFYLANKVNAKKKASRVNIDMIKANYSQKFCKKYYDSCDTVIAISDALKNQLEKTDYLTDKTKIMTVYNVFSVAFINKMANEKAYTDDFSGLRIATTGRLVEQKGYNLAVEAAEILKRTGLDFRWYFIGEGEKRSELETMIHEKKLENNITLLGMQSNPYPFMKECDIYVQTSLFEGFGRTVTEAKILHKPIISTNFPSVYDQMVDGQNGLIVEMNAKHIANKILQLTNNKALQAHLIHNVTIEQYTTAITESQKIMNYILL